jgi:hypothetical protein
VSPALHPTRPGGPRPQTAPPRTGHRVRTAVAVAVVVLATAACEWVPTRTFDATSTPAFSLRYLTRNGTDGYSSGAAAGTVRLAAPSTNQGTNTRLAFYPPAQPMTVDHQTCATWSDQTDLGTQQGLALRVRNDLPEGRWRAVTVVKNVVWGANWNLNVLTWDTRDPAGWTTRGSVDLARVFWPGQQLVALPWRVCARVTGDLVTVKGWPAGAVEPAWDDPVHTGSVRLPAGWVYAGKGGWYLGHLAPGHRTTFTDLVLDRLALDTTP